MSYLNKHFLQQGAAVGQRQLRVAGVLVLLGRGWRRGRGGAPRWVGHIWKVEEQVETLDQCGGHRHGRHAVHCFLEVTIQVLIINIIL